MNLLYKNKKAFWSEHQNEPMVDTDLPSGLLSADDILKKMTGLDAWVVPSGSRCLTAFVDVQAELLYWMVCAWEDKFTGSVIGYGTYPDQRGQEFTLNTATRTLSLELPKAGLEARLYHGLEQCVNALLTKKFDDSGLSVSRCLIDANWGQSTEVVFRYAAQSQFSSLITPSHGHGYGAASIPMRDYKKKHGDVLGVNWRIPVQAPRKVRYVLWDTNYWKSFVYARFGVPMGDPGCLSLYGRNPSRHSMLVGHLTSEYPIRTEGRGRQVDEWRHRLEGVDNHWFDCLVGCAVAASMSGIALFEPLERQRPREKIRLSDIQKQKKLEKVMVS